MLRGVVMAFCSITTQWMIPSQKKKLVSVLIKFIISITRYIGLYQLPTSSLEEAEEVHLIRGIDETFLATLKERIKQDPSGPGVPPLAVLCKTSNFSESLLAVYKYEILGGQHTAIAKQQLSKEHPENPYFHDIMAEVYVALTNDEALRLGSRHNRNGHYVHKMTHRDYVS